MLVVFILRAEKDRYHAAVTISIRKERNFKMVKP